MGLMVKFGLKIEFEPSPPHLLQDPVYSMCTAIVLVTKPFVTLLDVSQL